MNDESDERTVTPVCPRCATLEELLQEAVEIDFGYPGNEEKVEELWSRLDAAVKARVAEGALAHPRLGSAGHDPEAVGGQDERQAQEDPAAKNL